MSAGGMVGLSVWDGREGDLFVSESTCFIGPVSGAHPLHGLRPSPRRLLVSSRPTHGALYGPLYHLKEVAHVLINYSINTSVRNQVEVTSVLG